MKTKKLKLARTAFRWGLGAFVIGLISFAVAIALIQNPLDKPLYIDIMAISGLVLASLGFLSTLLVSLTFLPSILRFVTQNTQQHLSQNKKSYGSVISGIARGIGLLFMALFKLWAFLVANGDDSEDADENLNRKKAWNYAGEGDEELFWYYWYKN